MAKAEDIERREPQPHHRQQHISMQVTDFPRDLLQRFMNGKQLAYKNNLQHGEETEEIELSLGLSLNGRFGVDPKSANNLSRSTSIPDFLNPVANDNNNETPFMVPMACANLIRTCSLPTETEEDWRKRKELQTLRRMEAKRKRSEKQRNFKITRERSRVFGEENSGEDDKKEERDGTGNGIYQVENCVPFGVPSWVDGGKGACGIAVKGGGAAVDGGLSPAAPSAVAASQGSTGSSQGSGSSGISEFETQQPQGLNKCTEAVSPSSVQSTPKSEHKSPTNPEATTADRSGKIVGVRVKSESNKKVIDETGVKEVVRNVLEDMPCVSTKGDGPNGKRIEGFLYRYRKGEEVRIVCVCHGNFLTPAEFVKHAGGGDVTHPLKHIVVNPSSLL